MIYPLLPMFAQFALGSPPELPNLYWDVYSQEERIKKICYELAALKNYANKISEIVNQMSGDLSKYYAAINKLEKRLAELEEEIETIARGGTVRNPVTGMKSLLYVAFRQIWDAVRTRAATWQEAHDSGKSWADLADLSFTYIEFDLNSRGLFGLEGDAFKYTPTDHIDTDTPGF